MRYLGIVTGPLGVAVVFVLAPLIYAWDNPSSMYALYFVPVSIVGGILTLLLLHRNLRRGEAGFWVGVLGHLPPVAVFVFGYFLLFAWSEGILLSALKPNQDLWVGLVVSILLSLPVAFFLGLVYYAMRTKKTR